MDILVTYLVFALAQVSIFFYLKNNISNLRFFNYSEPFEIEIKSESNYEFNFKKESSEEFIDAKKQILLNKSLKHLEFISEFEIYLEEKNYKKFPIEFIQEFEKIKIEAQMSTIRTASQLNTAHRLAA